MKNIVIIIFAFLSFSAFAQSNDSLEIVDLKQRVDNLERKLERQIVEIRSQQNALFNQQQKVNDSLKSQLSDQSQKSETLKSELNTKLDNTNSELDKNVSNLSESISSNKTIAIIGIIAAIVLLLIVFVILRSKISSKDSAIDKIRLAQDSLAAAQKSMQEESVKLDSKLVELLEKQMTAQPVVTESKSSEPDHSFALKVGDEIAKIETNLSKMDPEVKGYKQLKQALKRIKDNFNAHGYEIVELLGLDYNDGMPFETQFVPDDTLPEGKRIISGITRLQINYKGEMIQSAKIVVRENI